jgi:hypothetical protein
MENELDNQELDQEGLNPGVDKGGQEHVPKLLDFSFRDIGNMLMDLQEYGVSLNALALFMDHPELMKELAKFMVSIEKQFSFTPVDYALSQILGPDRFFGPADWKIHFHISFPKNFYLPLPLEELQAILEGDCPFIKGKKVKETHFLYCLPVIIGDEPTSIEWWEGTYPDYSFPRFYYYTNNNAWYKKYDFAIKDPPRYSWFLMFQGVVPQSLDKAWGRENGLLSETYHIPKVAEVAPMHFLYYEKNGKCLNFTNKGMTRDLDNDGGHVNVGPFDNKGLRIGNINNFYFTSGHNPHLGIFAFRELYKRDQIQKDPVKKKRPSP